ncbi:hypothetical protein FRACYDRAFT_250386 [Fragilariopsis cylindrus CCMP1102]|uniref:Uncharacterized protein n=1 Tax=Fragilariopsis cylindrus CCMP1102 TaxID=635003 RepID=A0A1E7EQR4_9STRA|nr:hypothetical protein FRACYDRAFT_250386 [Fragilariopsis cylindrus CCMP1102]|eukprot:OEU08157.1 hypothetical protein FRACYDRAFT_250386 [Fragilariopsis cylindrus CCMP1102]
MGRPTLTLVWDGPGVVTPCDAATLAPCQLVWDGPGVVTPCGAATLARLELLFNLGLSETEKRPIFSCTKKIIQWDPDSILNVEMLEVISSNPVGFYYPIYDGNKFCQSGDFCRTYTDGFLDILYDEYTYDCSNIYCGPNAIRDCAGNSMTVPCTDSLHPLLGTFKYFSSECTAEWNGASCTCSICGVGVWGPLVIVDCSTYDFPLAFDQCSSTSSGVYEGRYNPELQLGLDSCPSSASTNGNDGSAANPSATNANDGSAANLGTGPNSGTANADPSAANTDRGKEACAVLVYYIMIKYSLLV